MTPDVLVGTLGKAFGSQGAFVAGRQVLRDWLWNRARSFVFSTGLAPVSAAAALQSLQHLVEHPELLAHVRAMAERLRGGIQAVRIPARRGSRSEGIAGAEEAAPSLLGFGHVVPVLLGSPARALRMAELLRDLGVNVHAIRPPTVPVGTARIRLTVTARHTADEVDRAVDAYAQATRRLLDEERDRE